MRYDAAIIGAGANGLAAAATLARSGLKAIVLERADVCGGRATTREFHPGFRASPYADEVAPIPPRIFRDLDLARHGAIFAPSPSSLALWPDRRDEVLRWTGSEAFNRLLTVARKRAGDNLAREFADAERAPLRRWFGSPSAPPQRLSEAWSNVSLRDVLEDSFGPGDTGAHAIATALCGRAIDPFATGSALCLLAGIGGESTTGGLGTLGRALASAAKSAGAEISLGLEASEVQLRGRQATGVLVADGRRIETRAVISTLDLRRTFFSLFVWKDLPEQVTRRVSGYRHASGRARLLLALDRPPTETDFARGAIHVAPDASAFARAREAWRNGVVPERPPLTLRLVSASDPSLAPIGKAVLTATLGCIPYRLFDGPWTNDKRVALREQVLQQIDAVFPGVSNSVLGSELILPCDIEEKLGITEGDLDGGDIAPDQMFDQRGFADHPGGRTPVQGLYLGGQSSPAGLLGTCAAGVAAARAVIADLNAGRLP